MKSPSKPAPTKASSSPAGRRPPTLSVGAQAWNYARLMRLDRPIGIWLLLWPTLWGLWLASAGRPQPMNFLVLVAGVVVMRSAGCVINDLADRRFDAAVRRTADRPLVTGAVTPAEAIALFLALGLVAIALVLNLNPLCRLLAVGGALLTLAYPLMKRFVSAPQLVLGAAFGWGILMAYAAETETVPRIAWLLWLCTVVWAVIYDTIYAMADRDDDLKAGVRSTAILFGQADLFILTALMATLLLGLILVGRIAGLGPWYLAGVAAGAALLARQRWLIHGRDPDACLGAFRENRWFGAAIFAGIALEFTFRAAA